MGLNIAILGQLTRKRRVNPSYKLFQIGWKNLICHNWFVKRSEIYPFVFYMACGEMIFIKISNFRKKNYSFSFIHLIFYCYYCSINPKRPSEHSGFRPDTSSLVLVSFKNSLSDLQCKPLVRNDLDYFYSSVLILRLFIFFSYSFWLISFSLRLIS